MNHQSKHISAANNLSRRGFLGLCTAGAGATFGLHNFNYANADIHTQPAEETIIPSTCNMCVNRCSIQCRVRDGVLDKIYGDPRNPKSRGNTCAKGQAGIMTLYDPDRIKHPLIRAGARGEGKWRRASWDEALDYVADNMVKIIDKHGPESLLWSSCTDLTEQLFVKFGKYLGTPNFSRHVTLCLGSRNVGYFCTMGGVPDSDLANARYILMFGANRLEAFEPPYNSDLIEGIARGAKLVTVDPRLTHTAAKGTWLPIKPRTDLALTLALMHVIIKEELYDKTFVAKHTSGFDELKSHVQKYTPEWAAQETDISAATIIEMAREMAAAAPAVVVFPGRRSSWYTNDTHFRRSLGMLTGLLGAFDTRGGSFFNAGKLKLGSYNWDIEPIDVPPRFDGFDKKNFPLAHHNDGGYIHLRDVFLNDTGKYPIKGWIFYKQNAMASIMDSQKTRQMMDKMDFICSIDIQPSQTAWMADVILPETTYLERLDPLWAPGGTVKYVSIRQPVVEPQGEARPILDILKGLAAKLDARHEFDTPLAEAFDFTMEDFIDAQLKPLPIDRAELMKQGIWMPHQSFKMGAYRSGKKTFNTPSGKIEFVSERLKRNGYDALPIYEKFTEEAGKQRLVTGRFAWFTHAANQNNVWLNALSPENDIWINPDLAKDKNIKDGEYVRVKSPVAEVTIKAKVTPRIRKDTVFISHGWGTNSAGQTTLHGKGAADQLLMQSSADEITNNQALHETFVEIIKI